MSTFERLTGYFFSGKETRASRRRGKGGQDLGRRRFLLYSGGVIAALSTGVGGTAAVRYFIEQAKVDVLIDEYRQKEAYMEPLIQKFEQGFGSFVLQATKLVENTGIPEDQKKGLQIPFKLFQINRRNIDRNIYLLRRKSVERTRSRDNAQMLTPDANFFFYDFLTSQIDAVASFEPPTRTIRLSTKYDPNNVLDNLVAMHEFIHVGQDNEDRQTLPYSVYLDFFSTGPLKTNGLYEATAYIKEIYMLNLFTQDQFRRDVIAGQGKIDSKKYLTILHARPEQAGMLELMGQMAYRFYNSKSSLTGIDVSFLSYVNSIYKSKGATPYMRTSDGFKIDPN